MTEKARRRYRPDVPWEKTERGRAHLREAVKRYRRSRKGKDALLRWRYGMSLDDYEALLDNQRGCCAICGGTDSLHVDHDHETGIVRGLLCQKCNLFIGFLESRNTVAALEYLHRHNK